MFESAEAFVGTGITNWEVSALAKNTQSMFKNAKNFNTDIPTTAEHWVVTGVTDMSSMFEDAQRFDMAVNTWATTACTDTSSMFKNALVFNKAIFSDTDTVE